MVSETPLTKEMETTVNGNSISVISSEDEELCKLYSNGNENVEIVIERDDNKPYLDERYYVIPFSKTFKISVYKPFLHLRIALFLWFGAGNIPYSYLNILMEQKGLPLMQFSWIISAAFILQFLVAFVSGIVADKLGNAKPVLMTHMFVTILCIVTLLFIPKVNVGDVTPKNDARNHNQVETTTMVETKGSQAFRNLGIGIIHSAATKGSLACNVSTGNCTGLLSESVQAVVALPTNASLHYADDGKNAIVFVYVALLILFLSSWSTVYHFMDVTVMSFAPNHHVSFGYERFFSISGYTLMTLLIGVILSQFTLFGEKNNYQSVYGFSACILFLSLVSICCIKSQIKPPGKHLWKEGFKFIKNKDTVVFFILILLLGSSFGFVDSFCLRFLEHLNASPLVFGLHQTLNGLYGLPFLFTSKWWLKKFGPRILFASAFCGYAVFGLGYSFLYNPWLSLLLQMCCILTYHLLWVAVIVHAHSIAPENLSSTIIVIAGATHYGLGRTVGNLCFRLAADAFGSRTTFRIFAGMNFLYAVVYFLFMCTRKTRVIREHCR